MVPGFDISHHNGQIDWTKVVEALKPDPTSIPPGEPYPEGPYGFVFCKATEGLEYVDPTEQVDFRGALGAGLITGLYHFFHPTLDPVKQANHFLSTFDNSLQVLTAIDMEWISPVNEWDQLKPLEAARAVQEFLDTVEFRTHRKPLLYYSPGFATQYLSSLAMGPYKRWIASYGSTPPNNYAIWQYSEKGTIPGITPGSLDLDQFNGTVSDLKALVGM